ncbi:hypothetical protein [Sphingomonas oligophenolica]|uniref:hypothetical protein n=1 Tax=Sphingomonas oligophenolica TaxID=301154 RepID=UPI001386B6EF|nr:hypothetical protein [Sphingomonas oligophenolica]
MLALFDKVAADEIVVTDDARTVLGVISENHARRRFFEAFEASQDDIFGESRRLRRR